MNWIEWSDQMLEKMNGLSLQNLTERMNDILNPKPPEKPLIPDPCPLCGSRNIDISKQSESLGMHEMSEDWVFECYHCGLVQAHFAADNAYGRRFYPTKNDAIRAWNETVKKWSSRAENTFDNGTTVQDEQETN